MMMTELQEKMTNQISLMDPETLMKTWMPAVTKAWGNLPEQLFTQFSPEFGEKDKK